MSQAPYNATISYCTDWFDSINLLWIHLDWGKCCYEHDVAYAVQVPKAIADWSLFICVSHDAGTALGAIMVAEVTIFGGPFYLRAQRKRLKDASAKDSDSKD